MPAMTLAAVAPTPIESRFAVLHRLLDQSLQLGPEYEEGMASHLPMALAALDGLGADEAQMCAFYAHYAPRLERARTTEALDVVDSHTSNWKTLRGRIDAFVSLRRHFGVALARDGRDAVLRDALPALIDGAAGAAFHCPIRVAHAIESNHAGELAAALAYCTARWIPLPEPAQSDTVFTDPIAWLDALDAHQRRSAPGWRSTAPLISERMQQAARTLAWVELAGALAPADGDVAALLHALAKAAAARYAATGNFTVLHMATASRAAQVLASWLPTHAAAWTPLVHAVAAASIASRAMPLQRDVSDAPTWADVRRVACTSYNDHMIKLVHAMAMQHARAPDPVWLDAARTAVVA
jgi:hypothetical protein